MVGKFVGLKDDGSDGNTVVDLHLIKLLPMTIFFEESFQLILCFWEYTKDFFSIIISLHPAFKGKGSLHCFNSSLISK